MLDRNQTLNNGQARPAPGAISDRLAHFAAELSHDDIPEAVRSRALHHILDAVGIGYAAAREDYGRIAYEGLGSIAGPGTVPVFGFPARWAAKDAATLNGLLCHGLDFDDTHLRGVIHPTVSQFPAAFSAAIMSGATTQEMVTAYVIGVEAATRLASVAHGTLHAVGFHPSGVCNAPAAALTAGRLMGLSVEQLRHAQGIALSMASGTLEFLEDGAWTKRLHPGWAASAGITAAAMAKAGYVGATSPYSGRYGLFKAHLGGDDSDCDYAAATAGLGEEWELLQTAIKPYPACHLTHGCIDAAIVLSKRHRIEAASIASIKGLVAAPMVQTICEPIENKRRPKNGYDAQFSIPYLVSNALIKGRVTVADLEPEALADPVILGLAAITDYETDPDSGYPRHYSGEVIVALKDGTVLRERAQINSGAPDMPVTDAGIVEKFHGNAGIALSPANAQKLAEIILSADRPGVGAERWAGGIAEVNQG
jgi:2-methylcitrate dehydratase PrpD